MRNSPHYRATLGLAAAMSTALVLCAGPASAGKYAYGEEFVRVGQRWADAGPVARGVDVSPPVASRSGDDYARQIAELELAGGPYSDALAEPLAGLGRHHLSNGELDAAMRAYRRALHVVRINDGLYSERQVPILRQLLDAHRVTGDMKALDGRYDYYFRLYGNGQPPYTEVRLRAALGYLRWQREAVRLEIDGNPAQRLLALLRLNDELLEAVAADPSLSPGWYRELVFSQLRNLYLLVDRYAQTVENRGTATEMPLIGSEWDQEDFTRRHLENMQRGSLGRGSGLLQELVKRSAASGPDELARIHLEWGDWYQWHGQERRAGEQYRQVVELLTGARRDDLLQRWLGQPVELPDNGAFWQPRVGIPDGPPPVVKASYDVSERGRVSNLSASASDPVYERRAGQLRRKLRQTRFRPRWVNGEPEAVVQLQREYELID